MLENITALHRKHVFQSVHDRWNVRGRARARPEALNYVPAATEEDGSCVYFAQSTLPIIEITTGGDSGRSAHHRFDGGHQ